MINTSSLRLVDELDGLNPALLARLQAQGFDRSRLVSLAMSLEHVAAPTVEEFEREAGIRDERNRVHTEVRSPAATAFGEAPVPGTARYAELNALGEQAIARGEVALCVLAGGMATRMGGVVKALVDVFDNATFLDLRLHENARWQQHLGASPDLWLMTSEATEPAIREALVKSGAPDHVHTFTQDLSLRLTPQGNLFYGDDGNPSVYATGHGDLVDALRRSGYLRDFRTRGGKFVWIANLDNLGATIDPAILGAFIRADSPLMVEVVDKLAGDRGGIPVLLDGRMQIVEQFRLPRSFDASQVTVFNTNTFLVRADALETANFNWSWFEVEKVVDQRRAIQFERLLQELTTALPSIYWRVPRAGIHSRFLPVKNHDELASRRSDIVALIKDRGMIP